MSDNRKESGILIMEKTEKSIHFSMKTQECSSDIQYCSLMKYRNEIIYLMDDDMWGYTFIAVHYNLQLCVTNIIVIFSITISVATISVKFMTAINNINQV